MSIRQTLINSQLSKCLACHQDEKKDRQKRQNKRIVTGLFTKHWQHWLIMLANHGVPLCTEWVGMGVLYDMHRCMWIKHMLFLMKNNTDGLGCSNAIALEFSC